MAEIAHIRDGESLKRWLQDLPDDVRRDWSLFIAHRAAARVAPLWWARCHRSTKLDLTDLTIWRVVPISRVAGNCPTRDIASASAASFAASAAASFADAAASAAASAPFAAAAAAAPAAAAADAADAAAAAAADAADAAADAADAIPFREAITA
ncbi:MAG: hypothetical protein GY717_21020, partial [Rhodobacteraceae bacterium]|nr:hypothetical protein [Paracoccaceae bacterium]